MNLKKKTIKKLQEIIKRDYEQILSKEEANELGISLLRLTRLGLTAQARAIEKTEKSLKYCRICRILINHIATRVPQKAIWSN